MWVGEVIQINPSTPKIKESLMITGGLAVAVLIFTRFDRQIMIFVGLFLAMEVIYVGATLLTEKLKARQRKK